MVERYPTLKKLRAGEVIDFDGIKLKMGSGPLKLGDMYIAERSTSPKFLTVKSIRVGIVYPTTADLRDAYDLHECVKVEEAT